jgi:hypothetical protein
MGFFVLLGMIITASIVSIGQFEPFESKDISNLFAESNSQVLRANLKIHPLQITSPRLFMGFTEQRQNPPCK